LVSYVLFVLRKNLFVLRKSVLAYGKRRKQFGTHGPYSVMVGSEVLIGCLWRTHLWVTDTVLNGFDLNQGRFRYDIGLNGLPTDLNSSTLKLKPGSQ
jgi:hypothetical protein